MPFEERADALVTDVHVVERELLAVAAGLPEVRDATGGEVINRHDAMALGQESVAEMRADEPRPARDEDDAHATA
jgi:hypothetical protein